MVWIKSFDFLICFLVCLLCLQAAMAKLDYKRAPWGGCCPTLAYRTGRATARSPGGRGWYLTFPQRPGRKGRTGSGRRESLQIGTGWRRSSRVGSQGGRATSGGTRICREYWFSRSNQQQPYHSQKMKKWSSLYGEGAEGKGQTREGAEAGEGAEVGVRLERLLDVGVRLKRFAGGT